jgi:hypothetical protein
MLKGQHWLDYSSSIEFLEDETLPRKLPCKGTHATTPNALTIQSLDASGLEVLSNNSVSGQTAAVQSVQAQLLFQQLSSLIAEQQTVVTPIPTTPDVDVGDPLASPGRVNYGQVHAESITLVTQEEARQRPHHVCSQPSTPKSDSWISQPWSDLTLGCMISAVQQEHVEAGRVCRSGCRKFPSLCSCIIKVIC